MVLLTPSNEPCLSNYPVLYCTGLESPDHCLRRMPKDGSRARALPTSRQVQLLQTGKKEGCEFRISLSFSMVSLLVIGPHKNNLPLSFLVRNSGSSLYSWPYPTEH